MSSESSPSSPPPVHFLKQQCLYQVLKPRGVCSFLRGIRILFPYMLLNTQCLPVYFSRIRAFIVHHAPVIFHTVAPVLHSRPDSSCSLWAKSQKHFQILFILFLCIQIVRKRPGHIKRQFSVGSFPVHELIHSILPLLYELTLSYDSRPLPVPISSRLFLTGNLPSPAWQHPRRCRLCSLRCCLPHPVQASSSP